MTRHQGRWVPCLRATSSSAAATPKAPSKRTGVRPALYIRQEPSTLPCPASTDEHIGLQPCDRCQGQAHRKYHTQFSPGTAWRFPKREIDSFNQTPIMELINGTHCPPWPPVTCQLPFAPVANRPWSIIFLRELSSSTFLSLSGSLISLRLFLEGGKSVSGRISRIRYQHSSSEVY